MSRMQKINYAEFGHNFIHHVVTARRIGHEIQSALDSTIAGTMRKLPADLMVVDYLFQLDDITVDPLMDLLPNISFVLKVLGDVKLDVTILNLHLKFTMDVTISVRIDVETYAPVVLKLVPHRVRGRDIRIDINSENLPSNVLDTLMLVEPIVRDQIVKEVNARIEDPAIQEISTIDVLSLVNQLKPGVEEAPLARHGSADFRPDPSSDTNLDG